MSQPSYGRLRYILQSSFPGLSPTLSTQGCLQDHIFLGSWSQCVRHDTCFLHILFMLAIYYVTIVDQIQVAIFVSKWGVLGELKEEIIFLKAHITLC